MLNLHRRWAPLMALLLVGAFLQMVIPVSLKAQVAAPNAGDVLKQAEVTYLEGDYEGAVSMLEPLLKRTDLTKEQTAKTHELLAYCYDALDKEDKIRENVRILFEMNRKYPMKDAWMADRMRRIVDEVKTQLAEQDSAQVVKPPVEAQKPSQPPDRMTEGEAGKKSNTKKYLIFGAVGVAAIAGIVLLAGGGEEELDTLPLPPGTPTKK